ncbi:hypothetical protein [Streptococcus sp. DD11]|uniref:hypothetical protein n=1 Tax=Streptococcus sp. DD11 TaxID=1777879 RepID=UPI00100861F5|nr:hypothetical protein [Streptococcus sp. DD11]
MAKTGTDYATWSGLTGTVDTSISGIADLASLTFSTTTTTPFTSFNEDISSFNTALSSLRTYTAADVTHMNQAAENKVKDDKNKAQARG